MRHEMYKKYIKQILTISLVILAIALVGSNLRSCNVRRGDSKRAAELERRASDFETRYAEESQLHSETLTVLGRTELELADLRAAYIRLEEIAGELNAANKRLAVTVGELEELHDELAGGIGDAQQLTQALDAETRRSIEIVERLQAGSGGTD